MLAACEGELGMARLLLEEQADPNACTRQHITSLMFASDKGHPEIVSLLLEYQADPYLKDDEGIAFTVYTVNVQYVHAVRIECVSVINLHGAVCSLTFRSCVWHVQQQ